MAKNDFRVRNIHWKSITAQDRIWFMVLCAMLVLLFVGIALDTTGTMKIPSWAALLWAGLAGFAAYRVSGMLDPVEEETDEEDEEEDEE